MAGEKELKATIVWGAKGAAEAAKSATEVSGKLENASKKMADVSRTLSVAGAAGLGAMVLSANSYVRSAGMAEATSTRWLQTTDRLAAAQMKIGRTIATEMLPYMEKAAQLADRAASFIEQNPKTVDAALTIGGVLSAAGLTSKVAGGVVGGVGGAVGLGAVGGYYGAQALGYQGSGTDAATDVAKFGSQLVMTPLALLTTAVRDLGLISDQTAGDVGKVIAQVGNLKGSDVFNAQGGVGGDQYGPAPRDIVNEAWYGGALVQFAEFSKGMTRAESDMERSRTRTVADQSLARFESEQDYGIQRTNTVRDQGLARAESEQDFGRQRLISMQQFQRDVIESDYQYNRSRSISVRDFNISMARSEQDRQISLRRTEQDHQYNLYQLARNRDAGAYLQEMYSYNLQKSRSAEDYSLTRSRAQEDQARSLADSADAYQHQRALTQKNFEIQYKIAEDSFKIQRDRTALHNGIALSDMDKQHGLQMTRVALHNGIMLARFDTDFGIAKKRQTDDFKLMLDALGNDRVRYQGYLDGFKTDFLSMLDGVMSAGGGSGGGGGSNWTPPKTVGYYTPGGGNIYGWASGGYARFADDGRPEYVLSASTTALLEKRGGGPLTQGGVLNGSRHVIAFENLPSAFNQAALENVVREVLVADLRSGNRANRSRYS